MNYYIFVVKIILFRLSLLQDLDQLSLDTAHLVTGTQIILLRLSLLQDLDQLSLDTVHLVTGI